MITRVLFAAILAGIAAGLVMSLIQHTKVTPLILQAEKFENGPAETADHSHDQSTATASESQHDHGSGTWSPHDGFERTAFTVVSNILTGTAFAFILAAAAMLTGLPITASNGFIWGLMGFLSFSLAPSAGLPPELPGMMAADLFDRQIWWWATVAATAAGILLLFLAPSVWLKAVAVAVIGLPHIIGAPHIDDASSDVPASLANAFAASSLATSAVFWIVLGATLGTFMARSITTQEATA